MAGDIILQLRDTRYPGQMEMRLQAAEIIEQYRKDSESDAALIKQLSAEKLDLAHHIDGCVRVAADALKRAEAAEARLIAVVGHSLDRGERS